MKIWKNMRYIAAHLFKASPYYMGFMLARSILLAALKMMELYVAKMIVDYLADTGNTFVLLAAFYGAYILLDYILSQLQMLINNKVKSVKGIVISKYMRSILYQKVKELDLACYENSDFYNDYERAVNEIDTRAIKIVDSLADVLYYILAVAFLTAMNFEPVFLLILAVDILQHIIYLNYINKVNFTMKQETAAVERKSDYIRNLFQNEAFIRESRTMQYADYFIRWNEEVMDESRALKRKYYAKSVAKSVLATFMGTSCSLAVMIYLCVNMAGRVYSPGDFVYLIGAFGAGIDLLEKLFRVIPDMKLHSLYVDNIRKILDRPSVIENKVQDTAAAGSGTDDSKTLELNHISFAYPGQQNKVLQEINIACKAGEKIAVAGENGCGKSTLVKLLLDFYLPDSGELRFEGKPYVLYNATELRNNFGVVFQDYQIYAFTVAENVLMRKAESNEDRELVKEALVFSGLWEKISTLEHQIDTVLTKEFEEDGIYLSGGEYQRLVIARAYARQEKVLIFDEPCSALDPVAEHEVFDRIMKLGTGRTVIYVSHRLANTVKADKIFYVENGKIRESGTHQELMDLRGGYCNMFTIQAAGYRQ